MMNSLMIRRATLLTASLAVAATLSACSTETADKPTESKAPTSGAPAPSGTSGPATPTEKKVTPGGGANSFTPSVTARPAPTALPGNVVTGG